MSSREPMLCLLPLFPVELITKIYHDIDDFASLVFFSQTCFALRNVVRDDEGFWKDACLLGGFGRSVLHKASSWKDVAAALVYHGHSCEVCSVALKDAPREIKREMKDLLTTIHPKSQPTTTLAKALTKERGKRPPISTGYDLCYYPDKPIDDRPLLEHSDDDKYDYDSPLRHLKKHVTLASFLATNEPVKKLITSTGSHVPFGYNPETRRAEKYTGVEGVFSKPEIARILKSRTDEIDNEVINPDGITCFDLLRSAAKVPFEPMAGCGENLFFYQCSLAARQGCVLFENER